MNAGDTAYKVVDGVRYQCVLFPLNYLRCTQVAGPGQYSHCCGTATDWAGPSARYPYYAPCDCHRVSLSGTDNIAMYVSDSQVLTPSGPSWFAFLFMHDDSVPSQTSFSQGDLIGHTGTAGFVTGDHVHLDQCLQNSIRLITDGTVCQSGTTCYYVENGVEPPDAYFITGAETIVTTLGQTFITVDEYTPGPGPTPGGDGGLIWFIMGIAAGRKKYAGLRRRRGG